ncbi:protein of unknown function [Gemmobacter megaterium]|uniref:DUF4169 domain-containing protein n=1 Tax=Gemmobacter megaterium TaxID=1086013 RepID=A0A1N7NPD0_9RHOB|nr:DUF4169 family protein [Gemmobacter megaterium]GGE17551.1 DUF4169 domain-containing protein [Gemmobacter megaterium]SIT00151.1 protein of unknown function [Gemmobacter megaterium]
MAELINLRQKRKEAARKAARTQADANAARFGRSKAEKELASAQTDKAARDLDGHKRDDT